MKSYFFAFIFGFVPIALKAQLLANRRIDGSIVNEQKASLQYASVILKNSKDSSIQKTAITNFQGQFSLENLKEGNYFMEISSAGFDGLIKTNLSINETNSTLNLGVIVLKASLKILQSITIKAQKPFIERQIDKTVINVDQSILNAGSTVIEMLKKLPGIQISSEGQISLNGKSGVTIFIDDKPTYLSASDLVSMLNGMPSSNIQKVEIMTNPSAKYDAAGTGGIINIATKKNKKEGLNGSVSGSFNQGHYKDYNGTLSLSYKNKKYNLYLNNVYSVDKTFFNRTVNNDILNINNTLLTEQLSDNNNITKNTNYYTLLGIDIFLSAKTILSITSNITAQHDNDKTNATIDIRDSNRIKINGEAFTSEIKNNPFNYTSGLHLLHKIDTLGKQFSIDLDFSKYLYNPKQNNTIILNDVSNNFINSMNTFVDQHRLLNIFSVKANYVKALKNNLQFEAGFKSSYVKSNNDNSNYKQINQQNIFDSSQSNYSVNTENINATYININKQYKKLSIQSGLRLEQTLIKGHQLLTGELLEQKYLQLFPSLFFDYKLNEQNTLNIRLGRRTQRAAYREMIPFRRPLTPTLYFQGNPNLKPQLTYHGEFTYSYKNRLFITLGYDLSHNYMRTLPYLDTNKVTVTRIPTNIQGTHSWNIDLAYSQKITKWWSSENSLSIYQNSFTGQTATNFILNNYGIPSFYFSTNNSFTITDKFSAESNFEYNSPWQYINSKYGAYYILSVGVKQQLFNKKATVSLNVNNILQSESHNLTDKYENLSQYSYWNFYTRVIRLSFTYRFGSGKLLKTHSESGSVDEQKRAGN